MEATKLTLRGNDATAFAGAFVDAKADEQRRSLNKRGVRNIHRYEGDGFTQIAYERGSAHSDDWLMVSLLGEERDDQTVSLGVFVGGGGEGPFKIEELSMDRLTGGRENTGQAGRMRTVLGDVDRVCESLDLDVEVAWQGEGDAATVVERIANDLFS